LCILPGIDFGSSIVYIFRVVVLTDLRDVDEFAAKEELPNKPFRPRFDVIQQVSQAQGLHASIFLPSSFSPSHPEQLQVILILRDSE